MPKGRFGADPATWKALNPIEHVAALRNTAVFVQTATHAFDRTMNRNFCHALDKHDIHYSFKMLRGGHTFAVVRKALPNVIAFMNRTTVPPRDR